MAKKDIAIQFLNEVMSGNIDVAYDKYISKGFTHHNCYFPGDRASLQRAMKENHENFPDKTLTIRNILESNDTVAVHSLLKFSTDHIGISVVHIMRFEGDQIAEMWDVAQMLPEDSPNQNGPL